MKKEHSKFVELLGIVAPPAKLENGISLKLSNWVLLHPELAEIEPTLNGLKTIKHYMHLELNRDDGPRFHIMDRLYKRYSNLRREMESAAMALCLPETESA